MSHVRTFFIQFGHFFSGSTLSMLLGLVSFPILTRALTKDAYGVLGLVSTTMLLAVAVAKAGLSDAILRFYPLNAPDDTERDQFCWTVTLRGAALSAVVVVLYVVTLPLLVSLVGLSSTYVPCFLVMAAYLFVRPLNIIVLNIMRIEGRTILVNVANVAGRAGTIGLGIALLFLAGKTLHWYFVGFALGETVLGAFLFAWLAAHHRFGLVPRSFALIKKLIAFGLPLLSSELSYLLLTYVDRYMITAFLGENALGVYAVGYNLAMYLGDVVTFSINYAVVPMVVRIFEKEGKAATEAFLSKCFAYLVMATIPMFAGYCAVAEDAIVLLASAQYAESAAFSPLILLGTFLIGLSICLRTGLYMEKRSKTIMAISFGSVAANVGLNAGLIPLYNVMGAAVANVIASAFFCTLTIVLSFRYLAIRLSAVHVLYYSLLSAGMYACVTHVPIPLLVPRLCVKVLLGVAIVGLGVLLKERKIRRELAAAFRSRFPRRSRREA